MIDLDAFAEDVDLVMSLGDAPVVAVVLGSGLDPVVEALTDRVDVPYSEVHGLRSTGPLVGHRGTLSIGRAGDVRVMAFRGRLHCYQGVSAFQASYPARLAFAAGVRTFVATNAAGSVSTDLPAGTIMGISDHINLLGDNPLVGWPGPEGGNPFVPMGDAYDPKLLAQARQSAADEGVRFAEGVYAAVLGPSYETPAESRALAGIGADAVGMSTVPEVIVARALGMRVLGLSLITNVAGGAALSHSEVLETGAASSAAFTRLLSAILANL